jgi:hypothetical protein
VGVNCLFNEVIPSYREEYFQDLSKLQFKMAKGKSTVKSLEHFVGIRYQDDELLLEFVTIRVVILQGVIVAYRAPVNKDGRVRFKEKSPIHTADVVRMIELSTSRLNNGESELSDERKIRSIFKAGIGHEASLASPTGSKKKVRFVLQELGREGQKRPRRGASALKQSNHHKRASTMWSVHDTQPLSDNESSVRTSETVHTTMPETVRRHESNDGTVSGRTVMKYDATLPEAELDSAVEQSKPNILERDSTHVRAGNDIFVAHKWSRTDKPVPDKRI